MYSLTQYSTAQLSQVQKNLQQQMPKQAEHHFCYFDIRNQQTLVTQSLLLFLAFVICLLAVKKYRNIWKRISGKNKNANIAFSCILIWWLSYVLKGLFGILIYILYNNSQDVTTELSWLSKFYFSIDWANVFILQTLLLFVPYHWMKQISQALSAVSGGVQSESDIQSSENIKSGKNIISLPTVGYQGLQSKIYPKLQKYFIIRALSIVPALLFLGFPDFQTISLLSKILLSILLLDCFIIILILSLGIHSIRTNQLLKMQLDTEQSKRLNHQYFVIIMCTLFRLIYDTYITVYGASEQLTEDDCNLLQQVTYDKILIMVATGLLAHYLPVIIILRIYTVDTNDQQQELTKSLVVSD